MKNSKSVLLSIRKKWVDKIFSGEKTLEIRKSFPKVTEFPLIVLLYECLESGKGSGLIVGFFLCSGYVKSYPTKNIAERAGMTYEELEEYANGKMIYTWEISFYDRLNTDLTTHGLCQIKCVSFFRVGQNSCLLKNHSCSYFLILA